MRIKVRSVLRLAFPYIIMALLPIVSVFALSSYILNNRTEQIIANQQNRIEIAVDRVERKLVTIEDLVLLITGNDAVGSYIINNNSGNGNDIFDCGEIQDLLYGTSQNENIAEIYFYDYFSDRIIASRTVVAEARMYFTYCYKFENRMPKDAVDKLRTASWGCRYSQAETVYINHKATEVIEYSVSVPMNKHSGQQSQLVIALNVEELFQDFFDTLGEGAVFAVYDASGMIYQSVGGNSLPEQTELTDALQAVEVDGKTVYGAEYLFNGSLWRVQFAYPDLIRTDDSWELAAYLLPAVSLPVVLCIGMCIYFTYKNRREIMDIVSLMRGTEPAEEKESQAIDYHLIRSYAGKMAERNRVYRTKLDEIHASQKNSTLERLIRGAYGSRAEAQKALGALELQIGEEACRVLCVQFDEIFGESFTINNNTVREMITDLLECNISTSAEVFDNLPTEIVCVFAVNDSADTMVDNIISLLNVRIKYQYGIDLRIGVGNEVGSVYEIGTSYNQAREVIRYSESTGKNISVFGQIDALDEVMFYPVQTDEKIASYMIAGRAEEARNVIMSIYFENFQDHARMLSMETIALVKYRITNVVVTTAEKQGIPLPEQSRELLKEKNVMKFFTELTALVDWVVEQIIARKSNSQNAMAVKVMEYVQEHYTDCGLSIKQIAASFHFHENYISNLYKEEYGENLSSAIERLRIERACELLRTTEIRIGDVAQTVGYSSDSSFRRAFKKIIGVSPVDYRNAI